MECYNSGLAQLADNTFKRVTSISDKTFFFPLAYSYFRTRTFIARNFSASYTKNEIIPQKQELRTLKNLKIAAQELLTLLTYCENQTSLLALSRGRHKQCNDFSFLFTFFPLKRPNDPDTKYIQKKGCQSRGVDREFCLNFIDKLWSKGCCPFLGCRQGRVMKAYTFIQK